MYGYIYDVFLKSQNKKYEKELIKIENTLTDLGLKGTITRLGLIQNVKHAVRDMLQKGIRTIIAVGSDQLFSSIADQVELFDHVTLGLIPMGDHQLLGNLFSIPSGHDACKILSARLIKTIPLGKINNAYFIHSAVIQDPYAKVICDEQYQLSCLKQNSIISVHNLYNQIQIQDMKKGQEQLLSTIITPSDKKTFFSRQILEDPTFINSKTVYIKEPKNTTIIVDGQKVLKTPAHISIAEKSLKVIVGKSNSI